MAYGNKGEYDLAIADYSKTIDIDPMLTDTYRGRARACYYEGEYDKAWRMLRTCSCCGIKCSFVLI